MKHGFVLLSFFLGLTTSASAQNGGMISGSKSAQQTVAEQWPPRQRLTVLKTPDWNDYNVYPLTARRLDQEGRVQFETRVQRDGVPNACRIVWSSGKAELDNGTCALALQMRFAEPIDESGKTIEATFRQSITWQLTEETPFVPSSMLANLSINAGQVVACDVSGTGPLFRRWSRLACGIFARQANYYFTTRTDRAQTAKIEVSLVPDGMQTSSPPSRVGLVAERLTRFQVNETGDPSECRHMVNRGFGVPRLDHAGPCGFFLTGAWFETGPSGQSPAKGSFGLRVYVKDN